MLAVPVLLLAVAVTLALTVFEDNLLRIFGNPARITEPPWLPGRILPDSADTARAAGGLCLKVMPLSRSPSDVLVSIINVGGAAVPFDAFAFRRLEGVSGWAVDDKEERHEVDCAAVYPEPRTEPVDADNVTLAPGASYSHLVHVSHPMDRLSRLEVTRPPYVISHFFITFQASGGEAGAWSGRLVSNPFDFQNMPSRGNREAYVHACYPRDLFVQRIMLFQERDDLKTDDGLRFMMWAQIHAMRYILPPAWFEEAVLLVANDPSPLVRIAAAPYEAAWKQLLLDPVTGVRRAALAAAAESSDFSSRQQPELTPILMIFAITGDTDEKVWALEGISRHGFWPQGINRQSMEVLRAAAQDADPRVRATAKEHFGRLLGTP
jgi:hypothetical protein